MSPRILCYKVGMIHFDDHLNRLLTEVQTLYKNGKKALFIFDLDSTLFDVSPRLTRILRDFAEKKETQEKYPESVEILKNIESFRSDWGIANALQRAGLDTHHPEFHESIKEFWLKSFFTDSYLHFDTPYEGAVEYVQLLFNMGVDIVYLTGRDVTRMGKGSAEVLLKWNFPLDNKQAQLVLKPHKDMNDAEFKKDWIHAVPEKTYERIVFFENEPLNVHKVREHLEHVEIVFFESTHAGKADPPTDLPKIVNYLLSRG